MYAALWFGDQEGMAKDSSAIRQTTLCYIDDGSRYLMLHRTTKKNDASHNKWIGVGGKCFQTESPEECMLREVWEETGLTVEDWRYRGVVTFVSDVWPCEYMHLFTATDWTGTLSACDEGELQWVDKRDIEALELWTGDRIFLRLLQDESQSFFSLKLVYKGDTLTEAKLNNKPILVP